MARFETTKRDVLVKSVNEEGDIRVAVLAYKLKCPKCGTEIIDNFYNDTVAKGEQVSKNSNYAFSEIAKRILKDIEEQSEVVTITE